jgi:hypothetical protein
MWRFLTIFPPNMATFATKFRKNLFGQLARDFLLLIMWLYKNSPEKKREKHRFQVPMDDTTAVLEPKEKIILFKKIELWRHFATWQICFQKIKENRKDLCFCFRGLFRHLLKLKKNLRN